MLEAQGSAHSLPVVFMIDASQSLAGAFHVIAQDGPLLVKQELAERHPDVARHVYIGEITCASKPRQHQLTSLSSFTGLEWNVRGSLVLQPALTLLREALTVDLIVPGLYHPGDYPPLVLFLLGERPVDTWQDMFASIIALPDYCRPLVISLITCPELEKEMREYSQTLLLLASTDASILTDFFFWVTHLIAQTYRAYASGVYDMPVPTLPYGIQLLYRKGQVEDLR